MSARDALPRLLARWIDGVSRRAWLVLILAVGSAAGLLFYTGSHLRFDTDTADMIAEDLPFRRDFREYKEAFDTFRDTILVVVDGEIPELADRAAGRLAERLRKDPGHFEAVFEPRGEFFTTHGLLYLDLAELHDVADRLAEAEPLLGKLARDPNLRGLFEVLTLAAREVTRGDADPPEGLARVWSQLAAAAEARTGGQPRPFSWQEVLSGPADRDDLRRFLVVQPVQDFSSLQPSRRAIREIRRLVGDLDLNPGRGVEVRLTGSAVLADQELSGVFADTGEAGALSLILVAVVLFWGLRSPRLVLATLVTLAVGLIWTAAFATAAVGRFNLISVAFAVLFIGLGVDFGIHYSLRHREELATGRSPAAALRRAGARIGGPLILCAGADVIAFYAFIPTAYAGVSELGLISGTGIVIALAATFTVFPALLTVLPVKPKGEAAQGRRVESRLQPRIRRHARTILTAAAVLGAAAALLVPRARFDYDPINLRDPATESVRTLRELEAEDNRKFHTAKVVAPDLPAAVSLAQRLAALPEVERVLTLQSFLPAEQEAKLEVIDHLGLMLLPVLEPREEAPPPSAEERTGAKEVLVRELRNRAGAFPPALGEAALRLVQALEPLGPRELEALEGTVFAHFPALRERLDDLTRAGPVALDDLPPLLRAQYLAPDGRAKVDVAPALDLGPVANLRGFVAAVREVAPRVTGGPVMILESGRAVVEAFQLASVLAAALITVFLLVLLRSVLHTVLILLPLTLAGLLTVAAGVLLELPFNVANVIVLPLLLGLGVDSGVHLVMRERSEAGTRDLLQTSTPRAIVLSALTTVGSFGTLALSGHRGTASMGMLLTLALGFTLVATLVVLPALMARTTGLTEAETPR